MKLGSFVAVSVVAFVITTQAEAGTKKYSGELSPDNEVPVAAGGAGPVLGDADPSGEVEVIYDDGTKRLCGVFKWRNMTGPPTGLHLHLGPAGANSAEKIVLPVPAGATKDNEAGFKFNVGLNAAYETGLASEGIYGNIHTAANKDGEMRATLFEFDDFETPTCPEPTVLTGGATDGGAAAGDGGTPPSSSSSTSSSSGAADPATNPAPTTDGTPSTAKKDAGAAAAPADEGGCSTATGAANASWLVAFGAVGVLAIRARRRRGQSKR